jgi:hypothetical protein
MCNMNSNEQKEYELNMKKAKHMNQRHCQRQLLCSMNVQHEFEMSKMNMSWTWRKQSIWTNVIANVNSRVELDKRKWNMSWNTLRVRGNNVIANVSSNVQKKSANEHVNLLRGNVSSWSNGFTKIPSLQAADSMLRHAPPRPKKFQAIGFLM